jgi:predicted small lipoprotein YifL
MRNVFRVFLVGVLVSSIAGCGNAKRELGLEKKAPDEFNVVRNTPLSLPPDYNLRPPKPGEHGNQKQTQRDQTRLLLTVPEKTGQSSSGEKALLSDLEAADPDPTIRQKVDADANILATDDRGFVEKMMFWRKKSEPGTIVDAAGEAKRLKENKEAGKKPTDGDTPVIEIKRSTGGIRLF